MGGRSALSREGPKNSIKPPPALFISTSLRCYLHCVRSLRLQHHHAQRSRQTGPLPLLLFGVTTRKNLWAEGESIYHKMTALRWKTLTWLPVLILAAPYLELVVVSIPTVSKPGTWKNTRALLLPELLQRTRFWKQTIAHPFVFPRFWRLHFLSFIFVFPSPLPLCFPPQISFCLYVSYRGW